MTRWYRFFLGCVEVMLCSVMVISRLCAAEGDLLQLDFSEGQLPSGWRVVSGKWEVHDGVLDGGKGTEQHLIFGGDKQWTDYTLQARVQMRGSSNPRITWLKAYLFFRVQDERNFYRFGFHGDAKGVDLYKCVNDEWKHLGSYRIEPQRDRWYTLKVEAKGAKLTGFVDGKAVITARDTTFPRGGIGLGVMEDAMNTIWDDISVSSINKGGKLEVELKKLLLIQQRVSVGIDASDLPGDAATFRARVSLQRLDNGEAVVAREIDHFDSGPYAQVDLDVSRVPAGKYGLLVSVRDAEGKELGQKTLDYEQPPKPAWLGSKAGITEAVLPPWTPLTVGKEKGVTVSPWGRRYEFAQGLFPSSVISMGKEILAAPIRLVCRCDDKELAWESRTPRVLSASGAKVRLTGVTTSGDLELAGTVTIEFDGMMRLDLELKPRRAMHLGELTVEVPLRGDCATLFHYWPGRWGSAYNSGALPAEGLQLPFKPFIWLGNEERGFAWFSESDRNWANVDPQQVLKVERRGDTVLLLVKLIDKPISMQAGAPLAYTMGFQATPVKPIPRDWHEWRICHAGSYDLVDKPYKPYGTLRYPGSVINVRRGTLEAWVIPQFDTNPPIKPDDPGRGAYNRDFVSLSSPFADKPHFGFYWNIDDRGMRFYVKEGERYPIILGARSMLQRGQTHHLALTWGDEVRIYVDGKLVAAKPFIGLFGGAEAELPEGATLYFGGHNSDWVIDEVRISDIPREEFDLTRGPELDEHTTLLDHLDEKFLPDGTRPTRTWVHSELRKKEPSAAGVPSVHTRFVPARFGSGLALFDPEVEKVSALDHLKELGVKTIVFHEHWTDVQNYTMVGHEQELKRLVQEVHKRGMKLLVYFGYEMSSLAPEWEIYGHECLVKAPDAPMPTTGYTRNPPQHANIVCYNSPWQDFIADGVRRTIQEFGIDGVYLDGTIEPWGCPNYLHGCGYRKPDGSWGVTYPIFAVRNLMRRLYSLCTAIGGLVNPHQSTCCTIPTLAFSHSYWDGEQFGGGELAGDPLKLLPLATFRAEFMGHNWGVPAEFLVYEKPPAWTMDDALAFTMLHDVCVRPGGIGAVERIAPIWNVWTRFGVHESDCQWHPYWRNAHLVEASPQQVKVSLYSRGKKGALLVVSNLGKEPCAASVRLNLKALGLASSPLKAEDGISHQSVKIAGDTLQLPLPGMRMRMILVR